MAVDVFLKIDGIDGESSDAKHKGEIEIESFSWCASAPGTAGPGGGGGAGRVTMEDFSFTTPVTRASPKLFLACVERRRIKTALLTIRRAGGQQHDFLKVTMSDVQISGWKQAAAGAELPMDQVSMKFGKVHIAYAGQRPDGTPGDIVSAGWDSKNTKI